MTPPVSVSQATGKAEAGPNRPGPIRGVPGMGTDLEVKVLS